MRELTVSFSEDGKVTLGSTVNYREEDCAARLAVTLSADLTAGDPDEYYISFIRDAYADNPMVQKLIVGPIEDIRSGVLYYELPSALTDTSCLAAQLEAVKKDADGKVKAVVKSPVFELHFKPSLEGEEVLLSTDDGTGLIAELLRTASETQSVGNQLQSALEQGFLNAKINGHNAVTLCGGKNLNLTDDNGIITVSCSTLPMVKELPQNPQTGEVYLLAPQNTVTTRAAGKELLTGSDMLSAYAAEERLIQMQQAESRSPLTIYLKKGQTTIGYISTYSDVEKAEGEEPDYLCSVCFCTKMQNDQPYDCQDITYINDEFSTERSSVLINGVFSAMSEVPTAVRLPDFDAVEVVDDGSVQTPVFYAPISVWAYQDRWVEITSIVTELHTHNNKATLDEFYCADIENPPTNPTIGYEGSGRRVLSFDGSALRFTSEGGVVRNVETLTANGQTFLRLWFDYGNNSDFEIVPGGYYRPAFIDIPVSSAVESTAPGTGGLIVNGTEIDFGISELETDRHTHSNMTQLNQLNATKMSNINDAVSKKHSHTNSSVLGSLSYLRQKDSYLLTYGGECVCNFPVVRIGVDSDGIPEDETNKYANIKYIIGDESHPVSRFFVGVLNKSVSEAMVNWNGEEFFFEFYTGETAPTVTLPFYLEFPTELTVEPNKHYQISIVDKVALWCASDYPTPAGEVTA